MPNRDNHRALYLAGPFMRLWETFRSSSLQEDIVIWSHRATRSSAVEFHDRILMSEDSKTKKQKKTDENRRTRKRIKLAESNTKSLLKISSRSKKISQLCGGLVLPENVSKLHILKRSKKFPVAAACCVSLRERERGIVSVGMNLPGKKGPPTHGESDA